MSLFEKEKLHLVLFVTRMVVMGFVRATCSRGGSVCKDWFDRAGKMVYWLTRNVLSVADFVWAKEGMELELPDGSIEVDPLRGEVKLNRVKHHYHEAGYEYNMSVTADAVQAARRASWWIFLYQFCRGLFKVQYAEMSTEAIEAALRDRAENGYHGIMPVGARISAVSALGRWLAGERGYQLSLESEPFFVQPKGRRGKGGGKFVFSNMEMRAEWFGAVFREVGDEMGLRPHASGLNSVRRNSMVGVQKGAERAGFDPAMHAKKTSQHRGDGHSCREKVYEDATASTDICAFLMGRTPQVIESLSSLAMTRVPELAAYRMVKDVAADDPLRVNLVEKDVQRLAVRKALDLYEAAVAKAKSAAQRSQAGAKAAELTDELDVVTRRLERRMLEQKRQQVYADGQRALADMPLEEFKARSQVEDWGKLGLEGLLSKLAAKNQCSKPVRARAQASGGSCSSGEDALVGCATASSGTIVARAERMEQRRHLRARSLGFELDEAAEEEVAVVPVETPEVETPEVETPMETVETPVVAQVETPAVAQVETPAVAMVAHVERVAQVETPMVTAVVLVETPVVMAVLERPGTAAGPEAVPLPLALGIRGEQRKREDELLVRYEQLHGSCPNTRLELSSLASVPLGTLDGMLSRARKRRKAAAALP